MLGLDGTELAAGGIFTQADIGNGRFSYTHDGSEITADEFIFQVEDDSGAWIQDPVGIVHTGISPDDGSGLLFGTIDGANTVYTFYDVGGGGTERYAVPEHIEVRLNDTVTTDFTTVTDASIE